MPLQISVKLVEKKTKKTPSIVTFDNDDVFKQH